MELSQRAPSDQVHISGNSQGGKNWGRHHSVGRSGEWDATSVSITREEIVEMWRMLRMECRGCGITHVSVHRFY